uniref:Predicted protein n=1 Tax=Physcomitrium patens TaxID=3218 RepID=A9U6G0_PHYPA
MDSSIASMFQAFSLSMQQQQSNDRKEALATKALQAVVNKIDQFDGRNISRYLRCYVCEMELNQVSEKKMVALFGLATISEIRDHITSITNCYRNSWEVFSHALKDEYFFEDADRVTKKLFLEWIEWSNKNLQYSQLSKVEKLTLEPNKVDLFLQAADEELQGKLELLLEDKEEDEGLTTKWKNKGGRIGAIFRKQYKHPKAPVCTTPPTMPTIQPSTSLSKKADMGMEEIIQGIRDLQIKLARLEENTSTNNSKSVSKQGYKDGKIALKDREDLFQTNFGKEGMRALVQDYLKEHETARESASYGTRVDDEIGGSTETTSQELPVKDTSASLGEKTKETKDKGKSIAYKLLSDIEAATNLKGVLEERILNAKVEFTLKEVLRITKKEFHDVIIDSIKRKRQLMGETGMSHAIDVRIYKDKEEVDIGYKQPTNEKNGYNQRVRFEDYSDKEMETLSHYTRKHWARATTEVLVKDNLISRQHGWKQNEDGRKAVQFLTVPPNHEQNRDRLREKPLPKIVEGFKDFGELSTLQDDERILGVYEENGLEDSIELITSIGLGDNDKIVEIHSREVYTILESFQAPEVTVETSVETRYKTADKKVKPVAGPLPEDSKEQMGEASKEARNYLLQKDVG